jgi:hypothetical protein
VHGDQDAVLAQLEVGLDVVGAELDRELVAPQRVLGQVAAGAAVGEHQRRRAIELLDGSAGRRRRDGQDGRKHQPQRTNEQGHDRMHVSLLIKLL